MSRCIVVAAAVCGLLFVGMAGAESAPQGKNVDKSSEKALTTVKGKVLEIKNKDGKVSAVKIQTKGGGMYLVTLDSKGKALGQKMDGKTVAATGVLTVKDKEKWLTVQQYKE